MLIITQILEFIRSDRVEGFLHTIIEKLVEIKGLMSKVFRYFEGINCVF